jgi:DNA-binding MarR family transcriptional regulator
MLNLSSSLKLIMNQSMVQSVISKVLDAQLSIHGISFSEFMILYHLSYSTENKMRRIDLANKTGLTASGITRLIAPMVKIGLVTKEANERDARVSFVKIAPTGERILKESAVGLDSVALDLLTHLDQPQIEASLKTLRLLGGAID